MTPTRRPPSTTRLPGWRSPWIHAGSPSQSGAETQMSQARSAASRSRPSSWPRSRSRPARAAASTWRAGCRASPLAWWGRPWGRPRAVAGRSPRRRGRAGRRRSRGAAGSRRRPRGRPTTPTGSRRTGVRVGLLRGPLDLGHPLDERVAEPEEDVVGALDVVGERRHGQTVPLRALLGDQPLDELGSRADLVLVHGHPGTLGGEQRLWRLLSRRARWVFAAEAHLAPAGARCTAHS